jgi:hypothetical protein
MANQRMFDAKMVMSTYGKISRRILLERIAAFASAAGAASLLAASGDAAEVKAAQSMVHFQSHPNQGQMCGLCNFFSPPSGTMETGSCKLVEGKISPKAWCILYAAR